jgi:hypothetical protein
MKKLAYFIIAIPIIMASCSRDPIADFFVSRNIVDVGESIHFTNNSIDADYFEWDFGDGTRTNSYDASHIYTVEGTYDVSLLAYNGRHWVDKAVATVHVLFPTSLEVIVLEYFDEYPIQDASVLLYNSIDDWVDEYNPVVEGFTNQYGETVFSNLNSQRYYVDVWEEQHHNYWLAEEDAGWIETHELIPNEMNTFFAYVDFVEEPLKSSGERDRSIMNIRKLEKVDRRMYEDRLESIKLKMEERKVRDEAIQKVDE